MQTNQQLYEIPGQGPVAIGVHFEDSLSLVLTGKDQMFIKIPLCPAK